MRQPHPLHPHTLGQAPELATLAVLDALLFMSMRVLVAEHPTLADDYDPETRRREPPTLKHARRIVRRVGLLQESLAEYRWAALDALVPPPDDDDGDIPF